MQAPKIRHVTPSRESGDYRLLLEFENGEKRIYDLAPRMESEVFAPLKTRELFERVRVTYGSLEWPGERDLAYDSLYAESVPLGADEELRRFAGSI
ncbi:MAG: DUF2442 domain-containing protein [Rhodothermales bacterium]